MSAADGWLVHVWSVGHVCQYSGKQAQRSRQDQSMQSRGSVKADQLVRGSMLMGAVGGWVASSSGKMLLLPATKKLRLLRLGTAVHAAYKQQIQIGGFGCSCTEYEHPLTLGNGDV